MTNLQKIYYHLHLIYKPQLTIVMDLPPLNNQRPLTLDSATKSQASPLPTIDATHKVLESLRPNQPTPVIIERAFQLTERQVKLLSQLQLSQLTQGPQFISSAKIPLSTDVTKNLIKIVSKQPTFLLDIRVKNQIIRLLAQDIQLPQKQQTLFKSLSGQISLRPIENNTNPKPAASNHAISSSSNQTLNVNAKQTHRILIEAGLRKHYPNQTDTQLFNRLSSILNSTSFSSDGEQKKVLNRNSLSAQLVNNLKSLSPTTAVKNNTPNIQAIVNTIFQSGIFLENKVLHSLTTTAPKNETSSEGTNNATTQIVKKNTSNSENIQAAKSYSKINSESFFSVAFTPNKQPTITAPNFEQPFIDNKAKLLILESIATQLLSSLRITSHKADDPNQDLLLQILKPLLNTKSTTSNKTTDLETTLKQLQVLAQSLVSRITTHQLQTLNQMALEPTSNASYFQTESLLRFGDSLVPFFMSIEEHPPRDNKEEKSRKHKKTRNWKVYMELEVDELGYFATEIDYQNTGVKTRFWIENADMFSNAKKSIDELQENLILNGVELESYTFLHSSPPRKNQGVQHSLVDIKT